MIAKEPCSSCPNGIKYVHYVIRFTGTRQQLEALSPFSEQQIKFLTALQAVFKQKIHDQNKNIPDNGLINEFGLEQIFFDSTQRMGFQGLITLQRVEENEIYNITQNPDGTINPPILCP